MSDLARMSFSYSQKTKDALTKMAKSDSRSLSSYVQKILNAHVERRVNGKKTKKGKK